MRLDAATGDGSFHGLAVTHYNRLVALLYHSSLQLARHHRAPTYIPTITVLDTRNHSKITSNSKSQHSSNMLRSGHTKRSNLTNKKKIKF